MQGHFCDLLFVCFGTTFSNAQGKYILAPCSRVTPGSVQEIICGVRDSTGLVVCKAKNLNSLSSSAFVVFSGLLLIGHPLYDFGVQISIFWSDTFSQYVNFLLHGFETSFSTILIKVSNAILGKSIIKLIK